MKTGFCNPCVVVVFTSGRQFLFVEEMKNVKLIIDTKTFEKYYMGEPAPHNDKACAALKEYEQACKPFDNVIEYNRKVPFNHRIKSAALPNMQRYADKYGITVNEMKEHWHCVEIQNIINKF